MNFTKRMSVGVAALGLLMLAGQAPREALAANDLGLVTIVSPVPNPLGTPSTVPIAPGATQLKVHLAVAFGRDINGIAANPATFSAKVTGMSALLLTPLFTDVKDSNGNIIGKKVDVTLPLKSKYKFSASVSSVIPPGATKPFKNKTKVTFVPVVVVPGPPVISNFTILNAVGITPNGHPLVNLNKGVIFNAGLSDPDGDPVVSYTLDKGDGSIPVTRESDLGLTAASETLVYSNFGDFTATLTAKDSAGTTASATLALHVNAPPVAKLKINPTQASFGYPVTIDALDGGDPDGDSLTYVFNFGDGTAPVSGTAASVTHTYPNPGVTSKKYTVTLTVTDVYGAVASTQTVLKVTSALNGAPMLHITSPLKGEVAPVDPTSGLSVDVALGEASSAAAPDPTTFKAFFNGVNATSYFSQVLDPKRGNILVGMHGAIPANKVLITGVSNSLSCQIKSQPFQGRTGIRTISASQAVKFTAATVVKTIPPTASFTITPTEALVGDTVTFNGSASSDPAGLPLTYDWNFGDNSPHGSGVTATHAYTAAATYTVTLTVSDGNLSGTATNSVVIRTSGGGGGGPPTLAVSIPDPASQGTPGSLNLGNLNGNLNISILNNPINISYQNLPAWVEKCVEVKNTGGGTLTIQSVSVDNTAAFQVRDAAVVQAKILQAGESDFIGVRFNPRPYTTTAFPPPPVAPGHYTGILTIVTNDTSATGTQTVNLAGDVVADIPGGAISLMHGDALRVGDDSGYAIAGQPVDGSVLDLGTAVNTKNYLFGGVVNEGDINATISGVDVVDDQGQPSPDYGAKLLHDTEFAFPADPSAGTVETAIAMAPGASLEDRPPTYTAGFLSGLGGDFIEVTFHPTNTVPVQARLSARMIIHSVDANGTKLPDQVVGLTGIGVDAPFYTIAEATPMEFTRTAPGTPISTFYQNADNIVPSTLNIVNIGRVSGTITASIAGINGGSPTGAITLDKSSLTLGALQSGAFTLTFNPSQPKHYSDVLTVNPGTAFQSVQTQPMHGFAKGGTGVLGTALNCYTGNGGNFTNGDFNNSKMISLANNGTQTAFSQIDGLQDPFKLATLDTTGAPINAVGMNQYSNPDWSSMVLLGGHEVTIDGGVFGPYLTADSQLNSVALARLNGGQPIYSGGILTHGVFQAFTSGADGHWDIQSDPTTTDTTMPHHGLDPIRLDIVPDPSGNNILFYTSVSSNLLTAPTAVVTTTLHWWNLHTGTGGVVAPDLVAALGAHGVTVPANDEVLDMRMIKLASGNYRAFFVFDDSNASFNQIVADMDLSSTFAVTAAKSLTGTMSAATEANVEGNGNQPLIIDASGLSYTANTVQNANGSATLQIFKEDLHAATGVTTGPTLFGTLTQNFGDADAGEVLLDDQGNVLLMTNDGLCAFPPAGGNESGFYVLQGQTVYASNAVGSAQNSFSDTLDLSDFNLIWFDK